MSTVEERAENLSTESGGGSSREVPMAPEEEPVRVPLGVWESANDRAESWEESYRELHAIAFRLTHCRGSGVRAFDDLRDEVEKFIAEEQS